MRFARSRAFQGLILGLLLLTLGACTSSPEVKSARFIEDGKKYLAKKDMSRAILAFRNAAKVQPKNAEAYYELGMGYLAAGDPRAGVASLRRALDLNPKHKAAELQLAELMTVTNDHDLLKDAQDRLRALLQDDANDPHALHALALTEFKLGDREDAMHHLDMAITAAPQDIQIAVSMAQAKLAQKDIKGAETALIQVCQKSPKSVDAEVILGQFYRSQNRAVEAEQQFQRAIAMDPGNGTALLDLAMLQDELGKKQEAEQTLKRLSITATTFNHMYGSFLLREGRNDEAIREFERLAKEDRDDRLARTRLVAVYRKLNRPADAEHVLNQALKRNPKDTDALLQRGEILLAAGKYDPAEGDFNKVIQMQPDSAEARYVLGKLYQAQGSDLRYQHEISRALELNPYLLAVRLEYAQSLQAKHAQTALDVLNAAPTIQQRSIEFLVNRNWALWALGNMPEMRKGIDQGLAIDKGSDLLIQDGLWKLRAGNAVAARSALEEALKINPADLRALQALRDTYLAQNNSAMALEKVKEYAAKSPKSAPIQEFLGMLLMAKGEAKDARTVLMAAKSADPRFTRAELSLAQLDIGQGKLDDAKAKLKGILAVDPGNTNACLWLGILQEKTGDTNSAIDLYRKVADTNPDNAQADNNLAYLLAEYGNKPAEALKYAEKAVQLVPDDPAYCDTLGWILYRKGVYTSAIPYLERAVAHSVKTQVVWQYHLAMAYAKAGNLTNGRTTLAAALKLNPDLPEAKLAQQVLSEASR